MYVLHILCSSEANKNAIIHCIKIKFIGLSLYVMSHYSAASTIDSELR